MAEEDADLDIDIDIDIDSDTDHPAAHHQPVHPSSSLSPQLHDHVAIPLGKIEQGSLHDASNASADLRSGLHPTPSPLARQRSMEIDNHPVDDFVIPDWINQDYQAQLAAADMDEKSRKMIESMLAEEAFYANNDRSVPLSEHQSAAAAWSKNISKSSVKSKHDSKKRKNSDDNSIRTKRSASEDSRLNAKLSSADLPSHNTRWTPEEDNRLREGILRHGYGNWKAIAAVVGTRNPLQVKNHARHLSVSDRIPHDMSTNTSDGEGLDRRSSAANSAEEDTEEGRDRRRRQPRSKKVKRIDASAGAESGFESFVRNRHRARSATSESGNDDFTGSEFGATSGYDTDNDDDRSVSRSGSVGLGTPSPGLRPVYASSPAVPLTTSGSVSRPRTSSMDVDEDIDIDIDSTDEDSAARLNLARNLPPFASSVKARSISPFSNSSTRSRMSSEFDSDSDGGLEDMDDEEETLESGRAQKRSEGSSPALSDTHGSSSDLYVNTNFNTSSSSINSIGTSGSYKPSLKDANYLQQQQQLQKGEATSSRRVSMDKISNSPKERRTVSFGAVHVAELQPDLNSYDEISSEDGGFEVAVTHADVSLAPSPLSNPSFQRSSQASTSLSGVRLSVQRQISSVSKLVPPVKSVKPQSARAPYEGFSGRPRERISPQSQDSEDDDFEEEEGSLGTGIKRSPHSASGATTSRKPSKLKPKSSVTAAVAAHSVSFQSQPTVFPAHDRSLSGSPSTVASGSPTSPRILDKSIITEEEKLVHSEFFCNKASKTPERYQRIRNTILQAWEKSPTTYLTKTSVRSGLKDCGDVNAIGRVHSWLESIGAINVGMTASSPGASLARPRNGGNNSSKRRGHSEEGGWSSSSSSSAPKHRAQSFSQADIDDVAAGRVNLPLRRRRVRNERGDWVDERELEGRVIEHNVHTKKGSIYSSKRSSNLDNDLRLMDDTTFFERHGMTKEEMEEEYEQERLAAQNAKYFAASEVQPVNTRVPKHKRAQHLLRETRGFHEYEFDDGDEFDAGTGAGYDPFRLVPLRKYNQQNTAPFRVKVSSDAMLIMDFHSHMAETEVIGLLGGLYDEDERILFILGVFPCRSISTGLQCEMDPESDVEARSFFSSKGFVVVGWYHSHPTFEPNPSIRDIENQSDHQAMFRRHELGVEPFVGVIVSPFDPRNLSFLSKFQFLSVSEQFDDRLNCRLPFRYDREITRTNELSVSLFQQISDLVRYYRTYEHRVDLSMPLRRGGTTIRLDKLLQSLNHHIFVDENAAKAFLNKVRELVVRGFQLNLEPRLSPSSLSPSSLPLQQRQQSRQSASMSSTLSSNSSELHDTSMSASVSPVSSAPPLDRSLSEGAGSSGSTPFKGPFTATMMEIETELASASSSLSSLISSMASSPNSSATRIVVDDTDPEVVDP